jgi:GMP synthase (glutamine-hydrolysing)
MSENVVIVNTHLFENPEFVGKLVAFMNSIGIDPEIVEGYPNVNPLDSRPSHIILTGVPIRANYSLTEADTRRKVNEAFGWLRDCECPVLGICYGCQILAQIFGGAVSTLKEMVKNERLTLNWKTDENSGIFSDVDNLEVFAEHKDFISEIPPGFTVLCQKKEIPYIMYDRDRKMFGMQFVPEQSDERSKILLKRFVGKC